MLARKEGRPLHQSRCFAISLAVSALFHSGAAASAQTSAQLPAHVSISRARLDAPVTASFSDYIDVPWRIKLGDDMAWASPGFDDGAWDLFNVARNIDKLRVPSLNEERAGRRGIYWMRLHLDVDSAAAGPAYLTVIHAGPMEVYLNGNLEVSFGDPNVPAREAKGWDAPLPLDVELIPGRNVLAVRLNMAGQTNNGLVSTIGARVFLRSEVSQRGATRLWNLGAILAAICAGVLIGLGVLHLFLFAMLRAQRAHGYYAGFAILLGVSIAGINAGPNIADLWAQGMVFGWALSGIGFSLFLLLVFLYRTFRMKIPRHFWVMLVLWTVSALSFRFGLINWSSDMITGANRTISNLSILLTILEAVRILSVAVLRKLDGARILAGGFSVLLAVFIAIMVGLITQGVFVDLPFWTLDVAYLAVPVASSIYLARDVGRDNRRLAQLSSNLEEEVAVRTAQLNEARIAADAANQTKSQFLANMSHELRTPLNAIIGYSEMLGEEARDAKHDAYLSDLEKIHGSGKHLLGLINDILDLTKIEAGRMELYIESFDARAMLADAASTIRPLVEKNNNRIEFEVAPEVGTMRADQVKVRQILLNLLSNASKFTEGGTISLTARREVTSSSDVIAFRVSDTGIGMTEEQVSRLFQPFMQAESSTTKKYGGTGLGLAITKHLVEMLGGTVSVESAQGKGTTFTARIPVVVREEPAPQPTTNMPAGGGARSGATILVIDDEPGARDMLSRMLTKDGYRVVAASNGRDGVTLAAQLKPDAITLDIMMGGMDGWSVLSQLKANPVTSAIPVVVITIIDDRNLGVALGAADYLTKPVDREQLALVLARVRSDGAPQTVLIVEDDADARKMMRRLFEKEGWTVSEAENGRVGLEAVTAQAPGLVLLDLMMPEMDGFEFVERLRANPARRDVPVVVLTAKDLTDGDRARLRGSVEQVLQKSGETQNVIAEVRRVLTGTRTVSSRTYLD